MTKKEAKRVRTLGKILFILYIIFLVYFLFLSDWYGREGVMDEYHYNLELFKEIKRFIKYRHQLGNILIFMPVGYFSAMAGKRRSFFKTLFWSFCLTFCVELMQLITKVGCFDVDDILLNTIGGVLGYIVFVVCNLLRRRNERKKRKRTKA